MSGLVPRSAVGNVSGYRCVSDCRSRGREFDPGPVPYFRGDQGSYASGKCQGNLNFFKVRELSGNFMLCQ